MSQLIHIRQRIQTVETIKRITNAMRLISRSSHFRLNKQRKPLCTYHQHITDLFFKIRVQYPMWHSPFIEADTQAHTLFILIGSNKGLCGNFNEVLFSFFGTYIQKNSEANVHIVSVGKKANDFVQNNYPQAATKTVINCGPATVASVDELLTTAIVSGPIRYKRVFVISNKIKNFFIYYPHATPLIPLVSPTPPTLHAAQESIIEDNPHDMLNQLATLYIRTTIKTLLFDSILAEQSARFISMDNATRNADTILESARLSYNKLRQAKITKDMIEIASSY